MFSLSKRAPIHLVLLEKWPPLSDFPPKSGELWLSDVGRGWLTEFHQLRWHMQTLTPQDTTQKVQELPHSSECCCCSASISCLKQLKREAAVWNTEVIPDPSFKVHFHQYWIGRGAITAIFRFSLFGSVSEQPEIPKRVHVGKSLPITFSPAFHKWGDIVWWCLKDQFQLYLKSKYLQLIISISRMQWSYLLISNIAFPLKFLIHSYSWWGLQLCSSQQWI